MADVHGVRQPEDETSPPVLSILCVDDGEHVLKALCHTFRHEPWQVLTASSGAEGLMILQRTENIGLIVSAQRMPEMTGVEFLHAAATLYPDIPRMILTDHADTKAAIDAINQGRVSRFFTKPWDDGDLISAVREGLQRYHLTRENQRLTAMVEQQNRRLTVSLDNAGISHRQNSERFRLLAQTMLQGVVHRDASGTIIAMNPAAEQIFGRSLEELLESSSVQEEWHTIRENGEPYPGTEHPATVALRTGQPVQSKVMGVYNPKIAAYRWISIDAVPVLFPGESTPSEVYTVFEDITERKRLNDIHLARLNLLRFAETHTLEEILVATLDELERLTGSLVGFYHFYDTERQDLHLQAWSSRTARDFCRAEGKGTHYPIAQAGVWVDCIQAGQPVIHNDYAALPHRKGLPDGHAPVLRELVVPVKRGGRVVAILGVGNKPQEYTETDVSTVSLFADLTWGIAEKKRIDDRLRQAARQYELLANTSLEAFFVMTPERRIIFANTAACHMYGYDQEEWLRLGMRDLEVLESEDEFREHGEHVRESGHDRFETRHYRKDGQIIDVEVSVSFNTETGEMLAFCADITEQVATKHKIIQASREWRSTFDTIPDLIAIIDTDYRIIRANRAMTDALKVSPLEVLGLTCYQHVHGTDAPPPFCVHAQLLADGQEHSAEIYEERLGGWFQVTASPLHDEAGRLTGSVHVAHDITALKHHEQELQEGKALLRCLIDSVSDLIFIKDRSGGYLGCNKACEEFLGVPEHELIGKTDFDFFDREVAKSVRKIDRQILTDRVPRRTEEWVPAADGRMVLLDTVKAPYLAEDGECLGLVGVSRDITERKHIEEALLQSKERFRSIMELSPDIISIITGDGVLTYNSPAALAIHGYSKEEMSERNTFDLIHPDDRSDVEKIFNMILEDPSRPRSVQYRYRNKDGSYTWMEAMGANHLDNPSIKGLITISRDITERKQVEEELARAKDAADAASRAKSEFLANISHEIRTPMNAIIGLGHLALLTSLTDKQRDYLGKITTSAEGLLRLLNDLLDFSKIEAGKLELEAVPFDLRSCLNRLLGVVGVGTSAKGLQLRLTLAPETPEYLVGDSLRLEQILLNLLGNAVKFTSTGEVELTVRPLAEAAEMMVLEFSVRDSGIGITPEQAKGIFEAFNQADGSITRRYGGTGLGLNICRRLVALMGGKLQVESELGNGSCFTFSVNMLRGEAPVSNEDGAVGRAMASTALTGCRVLVVDDQPLNQQVMRELLERVEADVTIAAHGREALTVMAREKGLFDAILMDLQMPEMDGYEATRVLRKEWPAELPIIAVTAHAGKEERERCLQVGMNDHLSKPVNPEQLYACILKWVGDDDRQEMLSPHISESGSTEQLPNILPGLDIYAGVAQLGGNTTLYRKLIIQFGQTQEARIADLRSDLDAGELDQAGRKAHGLKGIAGNLGATTVFALAGELEQACARNCAADAELLFPMLVERMAELSVAAAILTGGETSGQEIATSDLDTGAILELIRKLGIMVEEHNLAAQKFSELLCDHVAGTELAPQAVALTDSLTQVDFRTAKRRLEELTTSIRSWIF